MKYYWGLCKRAMILLLISPLIWAGESDYLIFSGNSNKPLAEKIAKELDIPLGKLELKQFNDGEVSIKVLENVRNKHVFIIQSTCRTDERSVNDNLMELYLLTRTLKRASAKEITAIIPYYGYARQDRKTQGRVPISASDIAMLLESSDVNRVVSIDLHAGQIQGFFHHVPVDNLYGSILMVPHFAQKSLTKPVVVSPDAGGVERAKKFQELLRKEGIESDLAIIVKQRAGAGKIAKVNLIGDVTGRDAIIIDDLVDTGGTLAKAAKELKKFGAEQVYASITHPVFSNNAIENLEQSVFSEVVVTDTIPLANHKLTKIKQLSIAPLVAEVIKRIHKGDSVSEVFQS